MPGNRKKGGGNKRNRKKGIQTEEKLILRNESDGELYARITKACGSGRFMIRLVQYTDNDVPVLVPTEVMGILPGRMRVRKWRHFVTVGDYVLIQQRSFQTEQDKVDILHKYDSSSAKKLIKMSAIPDEDEIGPQSLSLHGGETSGTGATGIVNDNGATTEENWEESFLDEI